MAFQEGLERDLDPRSPAKAAAKKGKAISEIAEANA
jgi:hypothetical protein